MYNIFRLLNLRLKVISQEDSQDTQGKYQYTHTTLSPCLSIVQIWHPVVYHGTTFFGIAFGSVRLSVFIPIELPI